MFVGAGELFLISLGVVESDGREGPVIMLASLTRRETVPPPKGRRGEASVNHQVGEKRNTRHTTERNLQNGWNATAQPPKPVLRNKGDSGKKSNRSRDQSKVSPTMR